MEPRLSPQISASAFLQLELIDPPDLTDTLQRDKKRIIGHGSIGTVYSCLCARNGEVAVKAITLPRDLNQTEEDSLLRKVRRELGIWRRLNHPNIVPFLGTARGEDFGSDHPCLVAVWMPNGTLFDFVKKHGTKLSTTSRTELIKGAIAGLEYLHSHCVVHGNLHPGNILIDGSNNVRLAGFGFSHSLGPVQDKLLYLKTETVRAGALMWSAPELLYPKLYPGLKAEATLSNDIYSFGSIIFFILSGKFPWPSIAEMESKLKEFNNPPRPVFPAISDSVWDFIERCWSPRFPIDRPSANVVLSFSRDRLEQLLQPDLMSDINVVLFGAVGSGKSSIVNLLADHPIAQVSPNVKPCTKLPQWYRVTIGRRRFRLWDTMGFYPADEGNASQLLPYEQAYSALRNITDGVNLILLCVRKDGFSTSLGNLYRLLNEVFYGGRAPIAVVVSHFDRPDEGWWKRNQESIVRKTGIPIRSVPHACITTVQTGRNQSRQTLEELLEDHATGVAPAFLRLNLLSDASLRIAACCGLSRRDADGLVKEFSKSQRRSNVILFGKAGAGKSSVINLLAGHLVAKVGSGVDACTSDFRSYNVNAGVRQIQFWDTVGFGPETRWEDTIQTRAATNATQLIRHLSSNGGIDLLVFVKTSGTLTPSEIHCYRFFREVLCRGQIPVALVVTRIESCDPTESWWETNPEALNGNMIGHACVPLQTCSTSEDTLVDKRLEKSRLSIQAMVEECISFSSMPAKKWRFGRGVQEQEDEKYQRRARHFVFKRMTG